VKKIVAKQRSTLAFDTSAFNRFAKDADPEPFIAAILSAYTVRIPEMSVGEVMATRDPEIRRKLHEVCRRLLSVGTCLLPAHWIVDLHVKRFHEGGPSYDWRNVNVRAENIEEELRRGDLVHDAILVEEQAADLRRLQDEFEGFFNKSYRKTGNPSTFSEWLQASQATGGSFWNTARLLYEGAFGSSSAIDTGVVLASPPDDATLRIFLNVCPPVRAFVYALELTLYDRSVRPVEVGPAYKAGRNDQMMAVFLPYCDQFLTSDGGQEKSLREVASKAGLSTDVRSYDEFCGALMLKV
jgi:hypothetical protein